MCTKVLSVISLIFFSAAKLIAAEVNSNEHQLNFFMGNFDFSDDK